jgi:hypothetical protein
MRITLENETAKTRGRVVLSTGQFMRIGSRAAELTGAEDRFMSSLHFLLECKADRCRIADMGSKNGTFVNGTRITDAILHDGDLILAGQTNFRVHIDTEEGAGQPAGRPVEHFTSGFGDETMVLRQEAKDLRDVLYARPGENLYALLDSTRDHRVLGLLRESKERYQALCEGEQEEPPCLVELPKGSPLLTILITEGWGKSWGVYLTSTESFPQVCEHFRHFLAVRAEGTEDSFRFYDPRVLRAFLPTCTESDGKKFFGPVQHILVEDDSSVVLRFSASAIGIPEEIKVRREVKDKRRRVTDLLRHV